MKILLIEPFYVGSHKQWCDGFQKHSSHEVTLLTLPGRHWKWRMYGAAVTLANEFLQLKSTPDVIVVSDMFDLTTFVALAKDKLTNTKIHLYFHENQLTYPWSENGEDVQLKRDAHYAFVNYTSALLADKVFFNSHYHLDSFISALHAFLKNFPDHKNMETVDVIKAKSKVLYLGLDLQRFDSVKRRETYQDPVILWNHRWEYDKNPDDFFNLMFELKSEGSKFNLVVVGESYSKVPAIFNKAKEELKDRILHFGYVDSFEEYANWLKRSDILPVTSNQDFFGGSVVEAMYCGVYPVLPNRLAYPEHVHLNNEKVIYQNKTDLKSKISSLLQNLRKDNELTNYVAKYDWKNCIKEYDYSFTH